MPETLVHLTPLRDAAGRISIRPGDFVRFRTPGGQIVDGVAIEIAEHWIIARTPEGVLHQICEEVA